MDYYKDEEEFIPPVSYRFRCLGNRAAKRKYGSRGFCHHARQDCRTADGKCYHFEVYIGIPGPGGHGCSGHNIWLYVDCEDA